MYKYERLTLHNLTGAYDWDKRNLSKEQQIAIYDRLCELEDKIEDGLLLELPCKVGDTLYTNFRVVGDYLREKDKPYAVKVVFIGINDSDEMGGGYINISYGENLHMLQFTFADIGKNVFLTKEQAEKKLKELGGKDAKKRNGRI